MEREQSFPDKKKPNKPTRPLPPPKKPQQHNTYSEKHWELVKEWLHLSVILRTTILC